MGNWEMVGFCRRLGIFALVFFFCQSANAYYEDYPPYKFKDSPPKYIAAEHISEEGAADFKSTDGKVRVVLREVRFMDSKLLIKDGNQTLMNQHVTKAGDAPFPNIVYWVDVDGNGFKDFIVLSSYRGVGIAAMWDHVDIFLKKPDESYQRISYDTWSADIHDFVDLNNNGKYQAIITGYCQGKKHNYYSYDIYEFKDYKLVNADKKFPGFPKYVWLTNKNNDKDTSQLSEKERREFTLKKDQSISQ